MKKIIVIFILSITIIKSFAQDTIQVKDMIEEFYVYSANGVNWLNADEEYVFDSKGWVEPYLKDGWFKTVDKYILAHPDYYGEISSTVGEIKFHSIESIEFSAELDPGSTLGDVEFVIQIEQNSNYTTIFDTNLTASDGPAYKKINLNLENTGDIYTLRFITDPNGQAWEDWSRWVNPIVVGDYQNKSDSYITFQIDMSKISTENLDIVGISGSIYPLNWNEIYPFNDDNNDEIYTASIYFDSSCYYNNLDYIVAFKKDDGTIITENILPHTRGITIKGNTLLTIDVFNYFDLIINGNFDNDDYNWGVYGLSSNYSFDQYFYANIDRTVDNIWEINLYNEKKFSILNKQKYNISFDAKTTTKKEINCIIQHGQSPWTSYCERKFNITNTMNNYSFSFEMDDNNDDYSQLCFHLGDSESDITIDNIKLITGLDNSLSVMNEQTIPNALMEIYIVSDFNLEKVAGLELHLNLDTNYLKYQDFTSSYLSAGDVNYQDGQLNIVWLYDGSPLNIPPGDTLFTINCHVPDDAPQGQSCMVSFVGDNMILAADESEYAVGYNGGQFTVLEYQPEFSTVLNIFDDNGNHMDLTFGSAPDATNEFDAKYDELAPPIPPAGAFDARFFINDIGYLKEFENSESGILQWNLSAIACDEASRLTIEWDETSLPNEGKFVLTDNNLITIDMKTENTLSITNLNITNFVIKQIKSGFSAGITVADRTNSKTLYFGTAEDATDGYDANYDKPAPPAPPSGFDARLRTEIDDYFTDIRGLIEDNICWNLHFNPEDNNDTIKISWNIDDLPVKGSFYLKDLFNGLFINLNMKELNYFEVLPTMIYDLKLEYSVSNEFTAVINNGWNLVGLSCETENGYYENIFPTSITNTLYGWTNTYILEDTLVPGDGYWLKSNENDTTLIQGSNIDYLDIELNQGWNIISGLSENILSSQILDNEQIIVPNTLYGFENAYYLSDSIKIFKGYWIKSYSDGQIILDKNRNSSIGKKMDFFSQLTNCPKIEIKDAGNCKRILFYSFEEEDQIDKNCYSLPPVPMGNYFDVRFQNDLTLSANFSTPINIQTDKFPVEISIMGFDENKNYTVYLKSGNILIEKLAINDNEKIVINDSKTNLLYILEEKCIAQEFHLENNYPNPFNPETHIKYYLPKESKIILSIYDLKGNLVKNLVNENQLSGYHNVKWAGENTNGNSVPSGVYFYKLQYQNQVFNKKMMLIK